MRFWKLYPLFLLSLLFALQATENTVTVKKIPLKRFPYCYTLNGVRVQLLDIDGTGAGMDRGILPLSRQLQPGSYDLYCRFEAASTQGHIEFGLADAVNLLTPKADKQKFCAPVRFSVTKPVNTLEILPRTRATLAEAYIVPAGTAFDRPQLPPEKVSADMVWCDFGTGEYPWWYLPDAPRKLTFKTKGHGLVSGAINIYNYEHQKIGQQKFSLDLENPKPVTLSQTPTYGPYLLHIILTMPDMRKINFQLVYAIIMPSPSSPCSLLGGHGNESFLKKMGASRERLWDMNNSAVGWSVMRADGTFDFSKLTLPKKLPCIVVLDRMPRQFAPTFKEPSNYYKYTDAITRHLKGKVEYYEILNEPYLTREWTSDFKRYAEIVTHTAKIIRQNDPAAKIATGGPTPEVSPGIETWESMLKAGVFNATDTISAHLYFGGGGIHPVDKDYSLQEFLDALRPMLKRYGQDGKKLMNTESGISPNESFLLGGKMVYGLSGSIFTEREPVPYRIGSAMYVRQYLIHRVNGVLWYLYHTTGDRGNSWSLCDFRNQTPLPAGVALAQAVRMLDGFTPVKRLQLPKGIFGCRFNKGDISTVILWGLEMHPGEIRSFSCSNRSKLTFRDIFGNQTNRNELGLSPLYITASSAEIDNFLRTLKVKSVRNIAAEATSGSLHTTLDNVPPQISVNNDGDTEVLLKWKNKQQIEWIEVAWKMGKRPEKYHISYLLPDGNWRYVQGTWRGWRKLRIEQENFPILKISTTALRLTWHDPQQQKSELLTFRPYSIKRITPQQTEMQEVYSREFHPDSNGFITDFLLCGPFPASGKRLPNQYPTDWKFDFLKDHYHYGRRWTEATLHPKIEQRHIVEFPRTPKTDWKVGKGAVHWIPYHATSPLVDMAKVFEKSALFSKPKLVESCYGYAFSTLVLSKPFKGTVSIGSDDGYRIWLDSKQLCEKVAYRSAVPDSEEYPLSLQPGEHHLMIRLHNDIGGHGFYLRLLDNAKKPFTDYSIKLVEKTWGK